MGIVVGIFMLVGIVFLCCFFIMFLGNFMGLLKTQKEDFSELVGGTYENHSVIPVNGYLIGDDTIQLYRTDGGVELISEPDDMTVENSGYEAGIKLHKIRGSELVRGRGGPRCMSMPLVREDL